MEKQKATFKVFSHKTGGVCLDLGDGEAWYELTEKVKDYVEGLQRDTEVLVTVDEDRNVSFIQPAGVQANNGQGLERVSGLKNQSNKRMSALNNATNLAIAQGGDALNKEGVLETSKKFLEFLGC